ncbi:MAG: hypothetical protein HA494_05240 [Thaumarchaeota archaeon]|nr:hypothetical protein [Nitrososphaerota archaeon]
MVGEVAVSRWANRFIWAAVIQGACALVWTILIVAPFVQPPISRIIAGGSAGTWFFVGYISYIVVGVIGVAVTSLFYHHIEVTLKKPFKGLGNVLASIHFILMNVGVAGATWLLMIAGYTGGKALQPTQLGGLGYTNPGQVHPLIAGYVEPIGYFIIALGIGVLAGGLGYVITYLRRQ